MQPDTNSQAKQTLRRDMRHKRRALQAREQGIAARKLAHQLARQLFFVRARHIAFYLANDGEIDPAPLMASAQAAGKRTYLPTLHPVSRNSMAFMAWQAGDPLVSNRFGIDEPRWTTPVKPWLLDIVFMPLVAFDGRGNRLGMGGGFYDRTFENNEARPLLIGLAHHFQECDQLHAEPWDIPLDGIATDQQVRLFGPHNAHRQ